MATDPRFEYAKLFFDLEDDWKLHQESEDSPSFGSRRWRNEIEAFNELARQGWEPILAFHLPELREDEGPSTSTAEYILRRERPRK